MKTLTLALTLTINVKVNVLYFLIKCLSLKTATLQKEILSNAENMLLHLLADSKSILKIIEMSVRLR